MKMGSTPSFVMLKTDGHEVTDTAKNKIWRAGEDIVPWIGLRFIVRYHGFIVFPDSRLGPRFIVRYPMDYFFQYGSIFLFFKYRFNFLH